VASAAGAGSAAAVTSVTASAASSAAPLLIVVFEAKSALAASYFWIAKAVSVFIALPLPPPAVQPPSQ
jgi:hypothetical protein